MPRLHLQCVVGATRLEDGMGEVVVGRNKVYTRETGARQWTEHTMEPAEIRDGVIHVLPTSTDYPLHRRRGRRAPGYRTEPCPRCNLPKSPSALLCRECRGDAQLAANHPDRHRVWKLHKDGQSYRKLAVHLGLSLDTIAKACHVTDRDHSLGFCNSPD